MSETLHLERGEVAVSRQPRDPPPRKPRRFRVVAAVFLGLLAIGFSLAWVVYRTYVAYEPKAARHVPSDAPMVVRFDLTHVMFYEPFRRSIFPLVDRFAQAAEPRRERLAKRGIRIGADVREVLFASGPGPNDWVVVLGGPLPRKGLGQTIEAVLREEGLAVTERDGAFELPNSGLAFAQAEDGAFVLASDAARLRAALPVRAAKVELTLGAGGFAVQEGALGANLGALSGTFRAGSAVLIELRAIPSSGASNQTQDAVRALLQQLARLDSRLERPAEQAVVERAENEARARVLLPREAVESVAAWAASRVAASAAP